MAHPPNDQETASTPASTVRWQYVRFTVRGRGDPLKRLNELGADGWELITVLRSTDSNGLVWRGFYLKRRVVDSIGVDDGTSPDSR